MRSDNVSYGNYRHIVSSTRSSGWLRRSITASYGADPSLRPQPCFCLLSNDVTRHCRLALQGAFPDGENTPSSQQQVFDVSFISRTVGSEFLFPEGRPILGNARSVTAVKMPETAVYKYDGRVPRKYQIRAARQFSVVESITQPAFMECGSQRNLDIGIPLSDARHNCGPGLGIDRVHSDPRDDLCRNKSFEMSVEISRRDATGN
jgi:hypothetical protein